MTLVDAIVELRRIRADFEGDDYRVEALDVAILSLAVYELGRRPGTQTASKSYRVGDHVLRPDGTVAKIAATGPKKRQAARKAVKR